MAWEDLPESTRSRLEDLFDYSNLPIGTIDHPSIDGLLILVGEGVDVWNAWAESNPDFHVDFSGHTFTEQTSFSGFIFPPGSKGKASFKECSFQKFVDFSSCEFPKSANFEGTKFLEEASFKGCLFTGKAEFIESEFAISADFGNSTFSEITSFKRVKFGAWASFEECNFLGSITIHSIQGNYEVNFERCQFSSLCEIRSADEHGRMSFSYSEFLGEFRFTRMKRIKITANEAKFHKKVTFWNNEASEVEFSSSTFISQALFVTTTFEGQNLFDRCEFYGHTSFRGSAFPDYAGFELSKFKGVFDFSCHLTDSEPKKSQDLKYVSFSGCEFHSTAKFDNRNFTSRSRFSKNGEGKTVFATIFHKAPTFHGCKFHQDTSFHGAKFIQDYGDEAAKAYRTLKLAFEQLKSIKEEQRFFKLEMQAERPDLTGWKWLFSWVYGFCSDYGFSIWRPLATLLAVSVAIGAAHGVIANTIADASWKEALTPKPENVGSERTLTTAQYVLINTIPAPGIDKTQQKLREDLFETETSPTPLSAIALFLEFIHKFIALLCVFLSGLAVRNLLKMKS
jgi:uncharacterized protein YjbI with pentapeptide repeats